MLAFSLQDLKLLLSVVVGFSPLRGLTLRGLAALVFFFHDRIPASDVVGESSTKVGTDGLDGSASDAILAAGLVSCCFKRETCENKIKKKHPN